MIQSFIDMMEGMIVGARQAHYAFGNPTLVRYLRAQLRISCCRRAVWPPPRQ